MKNITVIGAGTMGNGIAHTFAQKDFNVNLVDISAEALEKAIATIRKNLDRMVAKEKITDMVYANLKHRPGLKTISPTEVARVLSKKNLKPSKIQNQILAREAGKILSLDAVIIGQVRVFRERAGQ